MAKSTKMDLAVKQYVECRSGFGKTFCALTEEEQKLFSRLLLAHIDIAVTTGQEPGNKKFLEGVQKAFQILIHLCPDDPNVFQGKGLVATTLHTLEGYKEALDAFRIVVQLRPQDYFARFMLASTITALVVQKEEVSFDLLEEADQAYQFAEPFFETKEQEKKDEFYFQWSIILRSIVELSGEAVDYQRVIAKLRSVHKSHFSEEIALQLSKLLIDFGTLTARAEYFHEAIEYCKAVSSASPVATQEYVTEVNPDNYFESNFLKGSAFAALFHQTLNTDYFSEANDAFLEAEKFGVSSEFRLCWGSMLLLGALLTQQAHLLEASKQLLDGCIEEHETNEKTPHAYALAARVHTVLGMHKEDLRSLRKALEYVEAGLQQDPELAELEAVRVEATTNLGHYFNDEKYFFQAIEHAKRALQMHASNGDLLYCMGVAYYEAAEKREDVALYEEALRAFDAAKNTDIARYNYFWASWGMVYLSLADIEKDVPFYKDAERCFSHALALSPTLLPSIFFHLGCTFQIAADRLDDESYYEKAIQVYTKALELNPESTSIMAALAGALSRHGEYIGDLEMAKKAIDYYRLVIQKEEDDEVFWLEYGLAVLRVIEMTRDDVLPEDSSLIQTAEECFKQALNLGSIHGYYNLACLYSFQGRIPEALSHLQKAVECKSHPPADEIEEDEWFNAIRKEPLFRELLRKLH